MWLNTTNIVAVALTALANLFLAIYVYEKNPKEEVNKKFLYFGFVLFIWCVTNFFSLTVRDLFWVRSTYAVGCMGAITGIFMTSAIAERKMSKWWSTFLLVAAAAIFTVTLFTPFVLKDVIPSALGLNLTLGPLYTPWAVLMIFLIFLCIYIPFSSIYKANKQKKTQILYFATGTTIYAVWAAFVSIILPFFGIAKFSDFDSPATIFMVGFTSYSIIKYNLMNIASLFFRAFIYALVIVLIIAFLLLIVFASSFFFQHLLVWPIYVMIALISIVLFFIGRLFFVEKRDLEEAKIDLTKSLKRSEENLRQAETERDKTATIISSFSDGLIILDEKSEIFSINPEAEKIVGIKASELLKKTLQSLAPFPKAVPIIDALDGESKDISKKEVTLAKDFIIELSVIPLNLNGNDTGHLIVLHDISREKMIEKMKSDFVSLAAHQLRTPLSITKWSMGMLKSGDFGKLTKKQDEAVDKTLKNNEKLIFLVNELLNITRIEDGQYLYKFMPANMAEIVSAAIDNRKDEAEERKIEIDFKCQDDLPQTMADAEKVKLIVQDLIDNAVKYSPEGGQIIIDLKSDEKDIIFKIQDFGIGIPQAEQGDIFTKFFRADNAIKVNAVGTGLGLFLAQNIIEAHGGKLKFESEENKGTTFYLTLPIKQK